MNAAIARSVAVAQSAPVARSVPLALWQRPQLLDAGIHWRMIRDRVAAGELIVIRPGVYGDGTLWETLSPEQRQATRARALQLVSAGTVVFSHTTAAALLGYPLVRCDTRQVHTTVGEARGGRADGVVRHRGPLPDEDLVVIDGLTCTSPARTVCDVARTSPREVTVTITDAALRTAAGRDGDRDAAELIRRDALTRLDQHRHGVARARRWIEFGDSRAQLPGESISRIHLVELGFAPPRLQVAVAGPHGSSYYVDFGLADVRAFGEFDGAQKYSDARFLAGRTPAQALAAEKEREDWIRGTTQWRFARWQWQHIDDANALGRRLSSFGITPPG